MQTTSLKGARLSWQQERLWSLQGENAIYRTQCAVSIEGKLDTFVFFQAIEQMIDIHEIMHTLFCMLPGMDNPVQVIDQPLQTMCPFIDLEEVATPLQNTLLESCFAQLLEEPFDLKHGPLFCPMVFRLSAEMYVLLVSLPALCADAATLPLLITEISRRYEAISRKRMLAEEPLQYIDISAWQNDLLEAESAKRPRDFWNRIDLSQLARTSLPFERTANRGDYDRVPEKAVSALFEPQTLAVALDENVSASLIVLSHRYQVSLDALLLACWRLLLYRMTNEVDLVIGAAGNGRIYEDLAEVLGLYTRFVPISIHSSGQQTFEQAVTEVDQLLSETMQWQTYFCWPSPCDTGEDDEGPGYFPVTFEYESWPVAVTSGSLTFSLRQRFSCTEPFTLKLSALRRGDRLLLDLSYDSQHFSKEQACCLATALHTLLLQVVEQPQAAISALSILEPSEQERLLASLRAPQLPLPERSLLHLFEEHAQRLPNQLAVVSFEEELTYQQLNSRANQLARVLRQYRVGRNIPVGLCVSRSAQMIVALLAIFKAGGAYVPIDPANPRARLLSILQLLRPPLVLANQALLPRLAIWEGQVLALEDLAMQAEGEDSSNLPMPYEPDDLAYIIYTSGSTGVPKGVMISHQNILNYTQAMCDLLKPEHGWQFATVSTLAADLGNTTIFCSLAVGGCLYVLDYQAVMSAEEFAQRVANRPIDVLKITPSHLSALLSDEHAGKLLPRRALILGGEALPVSLVRRIKELGASCTVYNHYGPTETTIGVLVNASASCDALKAEEQMQGIVSLGKPLANTEVCIVDPWLQMVPVGMIGELCIGGIGLARGYLHQAELTAERFVPHPWSLQPGARLYRTGDLARYTTEGQIEFVGRRDNQVKLRGYRIELGEIEAALKQHPELRDGAVMLSEEPQEEAKLVGYIVPRKLPAPKDKDVRSHLLSYLPEYMVPSSFVTLKVLPLTANGKLDRQQLVQLQKNNTHKDISERSADEPTPDCYEPRDVIEFRLVRIWEDVLQVRPISLTDNFFELGGHSMLAVRLMSQIFKQFGKELDIATLFHYPTVGDLAIALRRETNGLEQTSVVAIQPQGTKPPFFCVHPSGGAVFRYNNLVRRLGTDYPFYVHTIEFDLNEADAVTVEAVAAGYVADLQAIRPEGPYLLGGWSTGGVVALEMAQQLRRQGHSVPLLAVIDSHLASAERRAKAREQKIELTDDHIVRATMQLLGLPITERFAQWTQEEQITYLLANAKDMNFLPSDVVFEQVRRIYQTLVVYSHIASLYTPQNYPQRIDYFKADYAPNFTNLTDEEIQRVSGKLEQLMDPWQEIAQGGLELHLVPGNHIQIMDEPNVQVLAAALRQCIDSVSEELAGNS